jgi:hypothetical protein
MILRTTQRLTHGRWLVPAAERFSNLGGSMLRQLLILGASVTLLVASPVFAATPERGAPERDKGISLDMLPKRVAKLDSSLWGFHVWYAPYLKPEKKPPVLQSTEDVLNYVRKQDGSVQANGIWIVTTHPAAYAAEEIQLLEDIKALCREEAIPLFIVRGSELPDGWQRYDLTP